MSTKKSKKESVMDGIFGPTLLSDNEKSDSTNSTLKEKDLVLLYFSASWCPPCKRFTPILSAFYTKHCIPNNIEIVYISSDSDLPSFQEYYGKMPFKSIPPQGTANIKQNLANRLKIAGIPSLVVLDTKTSHLVNYNARDEVVLATDAKDGGKACQELIQKWKDAEAVPIEEGVLQMPSSGQGGILAKLFMTVMKNPMYIVGIIFMVKRLLEKLQELGEEEETSKEL